MVALAIAPHDSLERVFGVRSHNMNKYYKDSRQRFDYRSDIEYYKMDLKHGKFFEDTEISPEIPVVPQLFRNNVERIYKTPYDGDNKYNNGGKNINQYKKLPDLIYVPINGNISQDNKENFFEKTQTSNNNNNNNNNHNNNNYKHINNNDKVEKNIFSLLRSLSYPQNKEKHDINNFFSIPYSKRSKSCSPSAISMDLNSAKKLDYSYKKDIEVIEISKSNKESNYDKDNDEGDKEEIEKKKIKQEKNKSASKKYRDRKKRKHDEIFEKEINLKKRNTELKSQIRDIENDITAFESDLARKLNTKEKIKEQICVLLLRGINGSSKDDIIEQNIMQRILEKITKDHKDQNVKEAFYEIMKEISKK